VVDVRVGVGEHRRAEEAVGLDREPHVVRGGALAACGALAPEGRDHVVGPASQGPFDASTEPRVVEIAGAGVAGCPEAPLVGVGPQDHRDVGRDALGSSVERAPVDHDAVDGRNECEREATACLDSGLRGDEIGDR
jgi:hypothetical protein